RTPVSRSRPRWNAKVGSSGTGPSPGTRAPLPAWTLQESSTKPCGAPSSSCAPRSYGAWRPRRGDRWADRSARPLPQELRLGTGRLHAPAAPEDLLAAGEQLGESFSGGRGNRDSVLAVREIARDLRGEIHLVEDQEPGRPLEVERPEHRLDGARSLGEAWVGRVDDVQQEVGLFELFQSGAEGRDEIARQITDESHRVGDYHLVSGVAS